MDKAKQAVIDAALNWAEAKKAEQLALDQLSLAVDALNRGTPAPQESMSTDEVHEGLERAALLRHMLDELDALRQKSLEELTADERRELNDVIAEKVQRVQALDPKRTAE